MAGNKNSAPPRVFISYSWTSEEHTAWVGDLGERLMSDGVEVILDQWSLEEGHDLNAFMERMVADETINRVIIVSDSLYAAKADERKGGVGTETQIISGEVYGSVDQNKFVPLLKERDESGNPHLPVYLKSRKYIDFSDSDNEAAAYDQLIRNIFERPSRRKPTIGQPPSYLFDESNAAVSAAQRAKRFREILATGRGNPSAAFEDFTNEFLENLEQLRIVYEKTKEDSWCQEMFSNIEQARVHRNIVIDVLRAGSTQVHDQWFMDRMVQFLERLLPFGDRPKQLGAYFECSEDNYKFLLYELFLYVVAILISAKRYSDARFLFEHTYVIQESLDTERLKSGPFSLFNDHPSSLEGQCADRDNTRRLSVTADLVHDRADHPDIRFSGLVQADVICCIAASTLASSYGWRPYSIVYSPRLGSLELFLRATTEKGFSSLRELLSIDSPQELLKHVQSQQMMNVWSGHGQYRDVYCDELFNLTNLNRIWGIA